MDGEPEVCDGTVSDCPSQGMSRDQRFYLADGNITICVCDTLFKVHRSIICQDGSTFENMFSVCIAQHDGSMQGNSDETPIYLQGDSPDEFRDLLWSLYALPHEIGIMMSPLSDIAKLLNIACMAHKYHFENVEAWALAALTQHLQTKDSTSIEPHSLTRITEVAILCHHAKLLRLLHTIWEGLIKKNKELSTAIHLFERSENFRDLLGLAYHAMMLQGRENWDSADPPLTREQRIRLLSGFYATTEICADFPSKFGSVTYPHDSVCVNPTQCKIYWDTIWINIIKTQAPPNGKNDLIGTMTKAIDAAKVNEAVGLNYSRWLPKPCYRLALDAATLMFHNFEIADLFQDVIE